jgi:tRNA pseudouridine38-40 synthase
MSEVRLFRASAWSLWSTGPAEPENSAGISSEAERPLIGFEIVGDGFLYNMVRAIVGTLINVGRGTWTARQFRGVLESRNRAEGGETAPAHGLYLVSVHYAAEDLIA